MPLKDKLAGRTPADKRNEREQIGFVRQPAVRWLSPGLLAKSGVEVVVSGTFGKFADKRETQREPQPGLDYSASGDLWVDFLADTGDGWEATYTMAWLLAQESLEYDGEALPRGKVLVLGGDEVYPLANTIAYEDRFIGPFAAALPWTDRPDKPELYALPGNHDWYDGLGSFLRVFCARDGQIGDWRTRQRRGYFGIKLPHDWWLLAIDIQLDTYIDDVQLDYFRDLGLKAGDKVILVTSKPAWVKALPGKVEPAGWRYLSYFEERIVRASGARLVMTLTGDIHHYARYDPQDPEEPMRLTAGGGGAYLSGTHTLYPELHVRSLDHDESQTVSYALEQVYPSAADSRRLSNGILKLALLNPSFAGFLGALYALLGMTMLGTLNGGDSGIFATATGQGCFTGYLAASTGAMSLLIVLALFVGIFGGTDIVPNALEKNAGVVRATKLAKLGVAALHTAIHVAVVAVVLWFVFKLVGDRPLAIWVVGLAALAAAGAAVGATVFGAVMLAIHKVRGVKAWENANQVFTGQSIPDYKNLVRMRFAPDGGVTLYPLGVDRVGRDWDHTPDQAPAPRFSPRGAAPAVHAIDVPLRFDARGHRIP